MQEHRKGMVAMVAACVVWGVSGLFYALLRHVPAMEVLAWRTLASLLFFAVVLTLQGRLSDAIAAPRQGRLPRIALAALMISANWFGFIYSIQSGHAVEASLGYYIFPLVAVLLGRVVFAERLSPAQWAAVGLAAIAVLVLSLGLGAAPWISLWLAGTFSAYGVLKKQLDLGPVVSVMAEVAVLAPIALVWAFGFGHGLHWDAQTLALLLASGVVTGLPLVLFAYATQRVRLSTVGLIQYLNPTLQFLVATLILAEPFTRWHMIAFPMIWAALALYSMLALRYDRASRRAVSSAGMPPTTEK